MDPLSQYIQAWIDNDAAAIERAVTEDCRVIESYGPVYLGRARVRQWADAWFADGGVVHDWTVTRLVRGDMLDIAEWRFEFTWDHGRDSFEGCSLATTRDGLVHELREYATSAPLYTWTGQWRD